MQLIKRFVPLCFVFFSAFSIKAQVSSADSMVQKLFATLPANDEKGFVALYPSPQQLMELVKSIMMSEEVRSQIAMGSGDKNINMDSLVQAQLLAMTKPEVAAEMTKGFRQNFQQAVEKGKAKNIDWTKAHFVSYSLDTASSGSNKDEAMLQKLGYKTMKGVIDFSVDTAAYRMEFRNVIFMPKEGGWYGGEFGKIVRKGESFDNADDEQVKVKEVLDSMKKPSLVKTKTKTSSTSSKTKVKTTTPAKKPATKS